MALPCWSLPLARPPRVLELTIVHQVRRQVRWRQPVWGLALIDGRGSMADAAGAWRIPIRPGCFCALPPGAEVDLVFEPGWVQWEARFAPQGSGGVAGLPVVLHPGCELPALDRLLRQAIAVHATAPVRAAAALWHLLCELCELGGRSDGRPGDEPAGRAVLDAALAAVARHPQPSVAHLARSAGRSPATLGRVFRRHLGMSPRAYLLWRRAARIRDLLIGTDLPIAAVAAQAGLPDIQHFNKFVRRHLGEAPRRIRERG